MSRNRVIVVSYILVTLLSIATYFNIKSAYSLDVVYEDSVCYMPNVMGLSTYEVGGYNNVMKCNLTTVNRIISNMISEDYYQILEDKSNGHILDIFLSNGDKEFRILYNRRTRDYTCFSNPFLENFIPATYIHE